MSPQVPTLRLVNQHLRQSGQSATRFGLVVARDPRLVHDMRAGRQPRAMLDRKIRAYLVQEQARATSFEGASA